MAPAPTDAPTRVSGHATSRQRIKDLGPWGTRDLVGTKLFTAALFIAVACGPAALAVSAITVSSAPTAAPAPASAATVTVDRDRQRAAGTAASFVSAWLAASSEQTDQIAARLIYPPSRLALPQAKQPAVAVTVHDSEPAAAGEWVVYLEATQAGRATMWRVNVQLTATQAAVLTLPAQVATNLPPERTAAASLTVLPASHPASQAADGFARAMLTDTGDITRWLAPTAVIPPVAPAPCKTTVTELSTAVGLADAPRANERARTILTVTCTDRAGQQRTLQYALELGGRDGRWEITALASLTALASSTDPDPTPTNQPT